MGKRNFREGNELRPIRKKNCVRECEILFFYYGIGFKKLQFNKKEKTQIMRLSYFYAFGFSQFERGIRAKTTKPPAMRVVSKNVIQNNHHSFYNEGVQAIKIRKNGDYNG